MALNAHYENLEFDVGPVTTLCATLDNNSNQVRVTRADGGLPDFDFPRLNVWVAFNKNSDPPGPPTCTYIINTYELATVANAVLTDTEVDACVQDILRLMSHLDDCPNR